MCNSETIESILYLTTNFGSTQFKGVKLTGNLLYFTLDDFRETSKNSWKMGLKLYFDHICWNIFLKYIHRWLGMVA